MQSRDQGQEQRHIKKRRVSLHHVHSLTSVHDTFAKGMSGNGTGIWKMSAGTRLLCLNVIKEFMMIHAESCDYNKYHNTSENYLFITFYCALKLKGCCWLYFWMVKTGGSKQRHFGMSDGEAWQQPVSVPATVRATHSTTPDGNISVSEYGSGFDHTPTHHPKMTSLLQVC